MHIGPRGSPGKYDLSRQKSNLYQRVLVSSGGTGS